MAKKQKSFNVYWIYLAIAIFFLALTFWSPDGGTTKEVPYSKLERALRNGCVKSVEIDINKKTARAELDP